MSRRTCSNYEIVDWKVGDAVVSSEATWDHIEVCFKQRFLHISSITLRNCVIELVVDNGIALKST